MDTGARQRISSGLGSQKARIAKALIIPVALGAFLFHLSLNLQKYLERKSVFITSEETFPPPLFPPYRLCVWPSWHPLRLLSLGFNISGLTHKEIEENYFKLSGIDGQTTGRYLMETAAWRPEDLLYEVKIGNIHEVYNSSTPFNSSLWHHSFTPLGPCITLMSPPSASKYSSNISIKFHKRVADMNQCQEMGEERSEQQNDSKDCPAAQQDCNSSYACQRFLSDFEVIVYHDLLSSSDSFWVSGVWNEVRLGHVHFGEIVVVEPFKVIPLQENFSVNGKSCYYKCLMDEGIKKANCTVLVEESLDVPVSNLCVTDVQQWSVSKKFVNADHIETSHCPSKCKSKKTISRWKCLLDEKDHAEKNVFTMHLAKLSTLNLKETEMYPLSQLLADTGGGLGLFLGVCALDGWNLFVQFMVTWAVATRPNASSLKHLAQLTGWLIASGITCVHLLVMVKSFLQQPITFTARQTLVANETNNQTSSVTLESLVVERMASRVLGCRASSTARLDECVKCLVRDEQDLSLPFISVDDLPRCTPQHITYPRLKFNVQKDYVDRIASKKISCPACAHLNDSRSSDLVNYVINEDSPGSLTSVVCALGGLVGLYFGWSLLDVANLLKRSLVKQHFKTGGCYLVVAGLIFTSAVVAVAVVICLLLSHTFLEEHPVYSCKSMHILKEEVLPSITTCVWPPVNIQRLLETAGLGAAYADVAHMMDPEERHAAITLLLDKLPQASNIIDPGVLWAVGAWTQYEIPGSLYIEGATESSKNPTPTTNTILNRCWKYSANESLPKSEGKLIHELSVHPRQEISDAHNYFLAFYHYPDEVSPIEPNLFTEGVTERINVIGVTKWRSLEYKGAENSGVCVTRCLDGFLMDHLGCRLPSAEHLQDLPSCNLTQFTHFLTTLWKLGTRPQNIYQHLVGRNQTRWCRAACSQRSQTFFMFRSRFSENVVSSGLRVAVNSKRSRFSIRFQFTTRLLEKVSAHDGYSITQLVSDLGSVVGMTIGASLLSLLFTVVTRMSRSRKTLIKVSSLPSNQ